MSVAEGRRLTLPCQVLEDDAELAEDFADRFRDTMALANQHFGYAHACR